MENAVLVQKNDLNNLLMQVEQLVSGMEKMIDDSLDAEALQRLGELNTGMETALCEEDYLKFIKKKGVK